MGNSLMITCAKLGLHFVACTNQKYFPEEQLIVYACKEAEKSGGSVTMTENIEDVAGADVIYTDVWVSMGEPASVWQERIEDLTPYKVTKEVMKIAGEHAIFMHCLPAFHDLNTQTAQDVYEKFGISDMEVTDEVFESSQSVVFDEAENRMHTIKAVMLATMKKDLEVEL